MCETLLEVCGSHQRIQRTKRERERDNKHNKVCKLYRQDDELCGENTARRTMRRSYQEHFYIKGHERARRHRCPRPNMPIDRSVCLEGTRTDFKGFSRLFLSQKPHCQVRIIKEEGVIGHT